MRRVRGILALSAATVLLVGCSANSDEPEAEEPEVEEAEVEEAGAESDSEPAESSSPSPSPSDDSEFSEEIEEISNLSRFCGYREGEVYDEAAEYSGDGPHTMAVNLSEKETDAAVMGGMFRIQEDEPFSGWLPDEPTDVELLACVEGVQSDTEVDTCVYTDFGFPIAGSSELTIPLHDQTFDITVYELATAEIVAETTLEPEPNCPSNIEYFQFEDEEPGKVYTPAPMSEVSDYLVDVVNSPAQ